MFEKNPISANIARAIHRTRDRDVSGYCNNVRKWSNFIRVFYQFRKPIVNVNKKAKPETYTANTWSMLR